MEGPVKKLKRRRLQKKMPSGWKVEPFKPEDAAPPDYGDPAESCDGADLADSDEDPKPIQGAADSQSRGWGPGWPTNNSKKMVTIVRADGQRLPVRAELAVLIALLCDETERLGYDLIPGWSWGFANRAIRGTNRPSNHSWGLALDLNAPENPMGPRNGKIRKHPLVIALWERFGFRSGTKYTGRADDMHVEYMGTPADAKQHTARAQVELGGSPPADVADEEDDMLWVKKKGSTKVYVVVGDKAVHVNGAPQAKRLDPEWEKKVRTLEAADSFWKGVTLVG